MATPVRSLNAELPFAEIDVAPLERNDLAAPQPRLSAQEDDQKRTCVHLRTCDQPFVLLEVVEAGGRLWDWQQANRARHPLDDVPFHSFLEELCSARSGHC